MAITYQFHYQAQIREYISQFMRIFSGLQTQDGVDRDTSGQNDFRNVNLVYGNMDRVIAETLHKRGTFVSSALPVISSYLTSIELNTENRQAPTHVDNIVYTDEADGLKKNLSRHMPTAYRANIDLSIYSSNSTMKYQLLEQILTLFNPTLTLQKSDDINDWTNITEVTLVSIATEENVPAGTEERVIIDTLSFTFDFYINYPFQVSTTGIIEQIITNVRDNTIAIDGIDMDTIVYPDLVLSPTDYVAYYAFEDLFGTDETGTYDFTYFSSAGITNVPMAVGNGISIPFVDRMETTNGSNPMSTGDLAVSFWHQSTRNSDANERVLTDVDNPSSYAAAFELIQIADEKFQFRRGNNANQEATFFTGATSINDGVLRHVVINCSGDTCTMYLNNVVDGTGTAVPAGGIVAGNTLSIGATGTGIGNGELDIDELKIYNRALTAEEITNLYNEGL